MSNPEKAGKAELSINRINHQIFDRNPALNRFSQEACEKIAINELCLSVANTEVGNYLTENNVEIDNIRNGDCFAYVKSTVWPLLSRTAHYRYSLQDIP